MLEVPMVESLKRFKTNFGLESVKASNDMKTDLKSCKVRVHLEVAN